MRIRVVLLWVSVALGSLALCTKPAQACADHAEARTVVHSHTHSHDGLTHSHAHTHQPAHTPARHADPAEGATGGLGTDQDHHDCCDTGHSHRPVNHVASIHATTPKVTAPRVGALAVFAPAPTSRHSARQVRLPAATGPPHLAPLRTVVLRT